MFETRTRLVNGEIKRDTPINKLNYARGHGCMGTTTLPLLYELAKFIKPRVIVVIGSGDGLIPRLFREAQIASGITGVTYLIDLGETMGAMPEQIHNPSATFRQFYPEIIVYKGKSVPDGREFISKEKQIDLLWIDGDHSHEGSLADFNAYNALISENGLLCFHDTAPNGINNAQPDWCAVNKTIDYIKEHRRDFELINFTPTNHLQLGAGFAILKRNLKSTI
jgi:cephalosporin hydroxylase